jgi:hypothetical protein
MEKKKITARQKLWRFYYLEVNMDEKERMTPSPAFGNAGKAAEMAGYKCSNKNSYYQIGHENLKKLEIDLNEVFVFSPYSVGIFLLTKKGR